LLMFLRGIGPWRCKRCNRPYSEADYAEWELDAVAERLTGGPSHQVDSSSKATSVSHPETPQFSGWWK
jgi:hypothetical protein